MWARQKHATEPETVGAAEAQKAGGSLAAEPADPVCRVLAWIFDSMLLLFCAAQLAELKPTLLKSGPIDYPTKGILALLQTNEGAVGQIAGLLILAAIMRATIGAIAAWPFGGLPGQFFLGIHIRSSVDRSMLLPQWLLRSAGRYLFVLPLLLIPSPAADDLTALQFERVLPFAAAAFFIWGATFLVPFASPGSRGLHELLSFSKAEQRHKAPLSRLTLIFVLLCAMAAVLLHRLDLLDVRKIVRIDSLGHSDSESMQLPFDVEEHIRLNRGTGL